VRELPRNLMQQAPKHRGPYPTCRKLAELLLQLSPHKEAAKLPGSYSGGPRATERVKDQVSPSRVEATSALRTRRRGFWVG
jgi:hypothetical protein